MTEAARQHLEGPVFKDLAGREKIRTLRRRPMQHTRKVPYVSAILLFFS